MMHGLLSLFIYIIIVYNWVILKNFFFVSDAAAAMKPTGNLYQDLQRKKSTYEVHTRKLSTGYVS